MLVHGVEVAEEEVRRSDLHGPGLCAVVAVAGRALLQGELEAGRPLLGEPQLFGARRVGDVVVLDPCEVPHEPGDGVRVVVEPGVEVLGREALDRGVYRFMNAFERIDENA